MTENRPAAPQKNSPRLSEQEAKLLIDTIEEVEKEEAAEQDRRLSDQKKNAKDAA